MKLFATLALTLISTSAFAGFSSIQCSNTSKTIVLTVPDIGYTGDFKVEYTDAAGVKKTYKGEGAIESSDKEFQKENDKAQAKTVSMVSSLSESCGQTHMVWANGHECYGREFWKIQTEQQVEILLPGLEVSILDTLTCTNSGSTSAGGCRVWDDKSETEASVVEEVPMSCESMRTSW